MARGKLTDAHKESMQGARVKSAADKKAALSVIETNSQFTNPKLWSKVDPETATAVAKAIEKAGSAAKRVRIKALEDELAALTG